MNTSAKLQHTENYDLFELHEHNRDMMEKPTLLASMQRYGFMPSCAIHCVAGYGGKLKVVRGHHRLTYAKRLGLPVWYIVDHLCEDLFALEAVERQQWSVDNFSQAYAKAGDDDYVCLDKFRREHGIALAIAASLVGGESAGSGNKRHTLKSGNFTMGDMKHANQVVAITDVLRDAGVAFGTSTSFISALSAALRCASVDFDRMLAQCRKYSYTLNKRPTRFECLEELEALYNYRQRGPAFPLKIRAIEAMKSRNIKFAGRRGK